MKKAPIGYLPIKHRLRKRGNPTHHAVIVLALVIIGFALLVWPQ